MCHVNDGLEEELFSIGNHLARPKPNSKEVHNIIGSFNGPTFPNNFASHVMSSQLLEEPQSNLDLNYQRNHKLKRQF